ncbi:MAG: aminotransferase class III-fold pyridoxal phosphate-dependent enzyme, partial [Candidatus Brocadiae bacterium]|nr:aminotransferase class III-fold pyridoxal phosphate-dependent enzyme [Candidatus Brocadiia bacterium]
MTTGSVTLDCAQVLGGAAQQAMKRARAFLQERSTEELLALVGQTFPELALADAAADKRSFPAGYGGGGTCDDDLLAGQGMFYVNQAGKLMLDCTSGHYQMTWGYNHPQLTAAAAEAMQLGVVWDNHSNIPSLPVKLLAEKLVSLAGGGGLDRVLLGVCTGSAACAAALKIMLAAYFNDPSRVQLGPPVMVTLAGNYHGTDIVAQTMRGMWPGLLLNMETVQV